MCTVLNLIIAFQEAQCPQAILHLLEAGELVSTLYCILLLRPVMDVTVPQYSEDFLGAFAFQGSKIATLEESCDWQM